MLFPPRHSKNFKTVLRTIFHGNFGPILIKIGEIGIVTNHYLISQKSEKNNDLILRKRVNNVQYRTNSAWQILPKYRAITGQTLIMWSIKVDFRFY